MTPDLAFTICNVGVLPAWLLLAAAPGWSGTQRLVHAIWIPLVLGVVYLTAMVVNSEAPEGGSFGSLEGVMILFTNPVAVLAGWVHYLVFDLFVGAWQVRDARRRGIAHFLVLPCLVLTLMLGPVGLMAYLVLRLFKVQETSLEETGGGGIAPQSS